MPERRVLYLTQHQLLAFRWQLGSLSQEGEFLAATADDQFAHYLTEHANSLFTLVVNLGEEGFHSDVIPYLQSRDRKLVISRRLGQTFLGAPLAVAIPHGHESGSRRNERLLLAALTGQNHLAPWLNAIRNIGVRLQGIYSLPLLTENLAQRLGIKIQQGILVTVQDSSVRQSFFRAGRLIFSRVAPLVGSSISDTALSIAAEANRFHQYLLSQRMVANGERLSAHILAHPQAIPAIQVGRFNNGIDVTIHDILAAAKKAGLKTPRTDSRSQNLFLHVAVSQPPKQQFATDELRQPYRLWQFGNAVRAAGVLALTGCLLFSLKLMVETSNAKDDVERLSREAATMDQNYRQVLGRLPPIPVTNDVLRKLIERVEQLGRTAGSPAPALLHLSQTLEQAPQVEITRLDWLAPGAKKEGAVGNSTPAGAKGNAAPGREVLVVEGVMTAGSQGSPRQLIASFDEFVRRLGSAPAGVSVLVTQTPFDLNASQPLKSADAAGTPRTARPFSLQIEYPVQP